MNSSTDLASILRKVYCLPEEIRQKIFLHCKNLFTLYGEPSRRYVPGRPEDWYNITDLLALNYNAFKGIVSDSHPSIVIKRLLLSLHYTRAQILTKKYPNSLRKGLPIARLLIHFYFSKSNYFTQGWSPDYFDIGIKEITDSIYPDFSTGKDRNARDHSIWFCAERDSSFFEQVKKMGSYLHDRFKTPYSKYVILKIGEKISFFIFTNYKHLRPGQEWLGLRCFHPGIVSAEKLRQAGVELEYLSLENLSSEVVPKLRRVYSDLDERLKNTPYAVFWNLENPEHLGNVDFIFRSISRDALVPFYRPRPLEQVPENSSDINKWLTEDLVYKAQGIDLIFCAPL